MTGSRPDKMRWFEVTITVGPFGVHSRFFASMRRSQVASLRRTVGLALGLAPTTRSKIVTVTSREVDRAD